MQITCLTFSRDGQTLLSRGMDDTVRIWDLRNFTKPLKTLGGLPCAYTTSKVVFSPDESVRDLD
jgi:WD40 repeat protein